MPFNIKSSGSYYATFDDSGLSANRTYTLPNVSGALLTTNSTASLAVTSSFAVTASYALSSADGGGGLGAPTAVVTKTADESVIGSSTVQDDDHLYYDMIANRTYWIEFNIISRCGSNSGAQDGKSAVDGNSEGKVRLPAAPAPQLANGLAFSIGFPRQTDVAADTPTASVFWAVVKPSTNYTLKYKWAQESPSATAVIIMKGSCMKIWETT